MSIDPRLAERRRNVAEDHAKQNVRRLLRFLAVISLAGVVVWFLLSPYLSVAAVSVTGAASSEAEAILAAHSVIPGTPMILLRPTAVETAIEGDPWVVDAEVALRWPDTVTVTVIERVPRAWVETAGGWVRRAEDGHAVPSAATPDNSLGWVRLPDVADADAADSELVTGAVEFLMALPPETARAASVRHEAGELWAVVDGYQVRLGRPVEMKEKALSLVTLLDRGLASGSVVVLIAPTHPAVLPPPETEDAEDAEEDGGEP